MHYYGQHEELKLVKEIILAYYACLIRLYDGIGMNRLWLWQCLVLSIQPCFVPTAYSPPVVN